jgi:pyruvate/2-oxoglutarate dehydrogenase complex dihydrolipoamide dehydrogenase (E3) component
MATRYDLVIVGMGSGGMPAAELAASLGVSVCAVERERLGGDCLWTGCVPSKALLAAGKAAHHMRRADRFGLRPVEPDVDLRAVLARVREVQGRIAATDDAPDRYRALGVDVRLGRPARLTGPHGVRVGDEQLEGRRILLCTGSEPAVPPIAGLREAGFLTSETLWDLDRPVARMAVIGGGPIAVELSQALRRLGVEVTVLQRGRAILPRDEPELAARLAGVLREEGVDLRLGVTVERVAAADGRREVRWREGAQARSALVDEVVVGAGRRPALDGLGLAEAGVAVGPRGVQVDGRSRTSVPSIYAVGDLTGRELFTHAAGYGAVRAVRDMFFPGRGRAPAGVPWCTFTDPELAHAGLTAAEARERHDPSDVRVWRFGLDHSDRARAERADEGALVVVTAKRRIVGAHILAPGAGELIHELALAMDQGLKLSDLASLVHVYPTIATSLGQLAGEAAQERARRLRWLVRA